MQMAGHSDFKTTERYIDLAGVVVADEVKLVNPATRAGSPRVPARLS